MMQAGNKVTKGEYFATLQLYLKISLKIVETFYISTLVVEQSHCKQERPSSAYIVG
jgi:hypothetical protein